MKRAALSLLAVPVLTLACFLALSVLSFVELRGKEKHRGSLVPPEVVSASKHYQERSRELAALREEEARDITPEKLLEALRAKKGTKRPVPGTPVVWLRRLLKRDPSASDGLLPELLALWNETESAEGTDTLRDVLTLACVTATGEGLTALTRKGVLTALGRAIERNSPAAGALLVFLSSAGSPEDIPELAALAKRPCPTQLRAQVEKVITSLEAQEAGGAR